VGEELEAGMQEISLSASRLSLRGSLLTKLPRKEGKAEAVHNLSEFDEIVLETRRKFHGKWLVIFAVGCGIFFLTERSLPVWVCAPFFVLAALIVFSWFRVGVHYLILRRAGETVEYRLHDTPAFVNDFFEQMSANARNANSHTLFVRKNQKSAGER
jgi:hypothetical protein